jgi:hypothetical protein
MGKITAGNAYQSVGTSPFGDVMKPAPHAKCIVGITVNKKMY